MAKTKEKMAEALKKLVKTKSIHKITIQDIVEESGMTRQSFYYHFHDIYEIIEWICRMDIRKNHRVNTDNPEEWIYRMFHNMSEERKFYRKVISEFGREVVEKTIQDEVRDQMSLTFQTLGLEGESLISFLTVSLTNYLILIVQSPKEEIRTEQIEEVVDFLVDAMKTYKTAKTIVKYA